MAHAQTTPDVRPRRDTPALLPPGALLLGGFSLCAQAEPTAAPQAQDLPAVTVKAAAEAPADGYRATTTRVGNQPVKDVLLLASSPAPARTKLRTFVEQELNPHVREWEDAGFRDVFASRGLKLAEWPEKAEGLLPCPDLRIAIEPLANEARRVTLAAYTPRGLEILA